MASVKTAISIEESLFKEAEQLARDMNLSRSGLVCLALRKYIEKWKAEDLTCRIDEALADYPDEEDEAAARFSEAAVADVLKDDPW